MIGTYEQLGLCLILALLLAFYVLATQFTSLVWRLGARFTKRLSENSRDNLLFVVGVLPALYAIAGVAFVVFPAYVFYEPRDTGESVGVTLGVLTTISVLGLLQAVGRTTRGHLSTRRILSDWLRHSTPLRISGLSIPAFRLEHENPIVALVGTLNPRLFIAECVLRTLKTDELSAVIAHERAHLAGRHNLKRAILRCSNLLPCSPLNSSLEREWIEVSEQAADVRAASHGETPLHLASALVTIGRLSPTGVMLATPISAALATEGNIEVRVNRLLRLASEPAQKARESSFFGVMFHLIVFALPLVAAFWIGINREQLRAAHQFIETIVNSLH